MRFSELVRRVRRASVVREAHTLRARVRRRVGKDAVSPPRLEDQAPWMSPSVWHRIESSYRNIPNPRIFEYGTGASTLWHLRQLAQRGGTYVGVEHRPEWSRRVLEAALRFGVHNHLDLSVSHGPLRPTDPLDPAYDVDLTLRGADEVACRLLLRLRPPRRRGPDADGSLEEFRDYVLALDAPCDLVVVDGMARKPCVRHALAAGGLKPGGTLVLCEAGHGVAGWLGRAARPGASDYQPEVRRMLAAGGELVDGEGLDRWPGLKVRRSPIAMAYHYPSEACFLRLPADPAAAARRTARRNPPDSVARSAPEGAVGER